LFCLQSVLVASELSNIPFLAFHFHLVFTYQTL